MKDKAKEFFEKRCKEVGIDRIDFSTAFNPDEVISLMTDFGNHLTKTNYK